MTKKTLGRKKGGRNRGYFFRKGRSWFATERKRMIPLLDKDGERITSPNASQEEVRDAYGPTGREKGTGVISPGL